MSNPAVGRSNRWAQAHESGLEDVAPARDGREEMRLVDDDQVVVAVHDPDLERHGRLVGEVPVEPQELLRNERCVRCDRPVAVDDALLGQHGVDPGRVDAGEPFDQVIAHRGPPWTVRGFRRRPQPHRVEPVPLRKRRGQLAPQ
jgi:hypothetical protein